MKHMKRRLSAVFFAAAALLAVVMAAVVVHEYFALAACNTCSAPPEAAFLLGIPFAVGAALCLVLAVVLKRK